MRSLSPSFVVAPPTGAKVRTRLRLSPADEKVLRQVGEYLSGLAGADLAVRSRLRRGPDGRAGRKRALTAASSSRWAGAITRTANDQWTRGYMNLQQECASLQRAIHRLRQRIQAPVGGKADRVRGYATPGERWAKQRRLQTLSTRLVRVEGRLAADRVSVVRGGRRLARTRHHLEVAGLTLERWQQTWVAERLFLTADGEADKAWGNETIRWHPVQGWLELKLPTPLAYLANRPHGRYPVSLTYRGDEVAAQAVSGAVRYDITLDPDRQRWHLHASWTVQPAPIPSVDEAVADGVVAVDLNADHLACWTIDRHGNPVGGPVTIPLDFAGLPTSTRGGHLREASSTVTGGSPARATAAQADPNPGACTARDHPTPPPHSPGWSDGTRPPGPTRPRRPRTVREPPISRK